MDAETRHQLKQNELAEALTRLSKLNDKRIGYAIVALVVIAIVYVGFRVQRNRHQSTLAAGWEALTSISVAGGDASIQQLRTLIDGASDKGLIDAAKLKLGIALKQRAISGDEASGREAIEVLQSVVDDPDAPASLRAAALFNIGFLQENARDFDAARVTYGKIVDAAEFAGLPFPEFAAERLEKLDEIATPVVFEPGFPEIETPPPTSAPTAPPTMDALTTAPASAAQPPAEESGAADEPSAADEAEAAEQPAPTSAPAGDEPQEPTTDTPEQP